EEVKSRKAKGKSEGGLNALTLAFLLLTSPMYDSSPDVRPGVVPSPKSCDDSQPSNRFFVLHLRTAPRSSAQREPKDFSSAGRGLLGVKSERHSHHLGLPAFRSLLRHPPHETLFVSRGRARTPRRPEPARALRRPGPRRRVPFGQPQAG